MNQHSEPTTSRSNANSISDAGMRPWHPSLDVLDGVADLGLAPTAVSLRDDKDLAVDQLLWNALEPNPIFEHPQAARVLRAIATELVDTVDNLAYLHPEDLAFHAKAAAVRVSNAGLATHVIGDAVTGAQVMEFLGLTQGELAQLVIDDEVVFVHDVWESTRLFPLWQFDVEAGTIRPEAAIVLQGFRGTPFHRHRFALLNWMASVQPGDLPGELSPVEWIEAGYDITTLTELVHRTAASL